MKINFKIILVVLAVIAVSTGGYFIWRNIISPAQIVPEAVTTESAKVESLSIPKVIGEDTVFSYWINRKTGGIYYIKETGEVYKIAADGTIQNTETRAIGNLSQVKPSPDGSLILVSFGYPQSPTFAIHNTASKTWRALPAETAAAAWDPTSSNRLMYLKNNGGVSRLNSYTVSDGKSKEILKLSQKDLDLEWVVPDEIYLKERISAQTSSSIWAVNLKTGIIRTVIRDEVAPMVKWSSNGEVGIKWNGNLNLIDKNNKLLATVDLVTFPSKCVFATDQIYCAVPSVPSTSMVLLDDYLKKESKAGDDFYAIELAGVGLHESLLNFEVFNKIFIDFPIGAERLEVINNTLYFINRYDKKLYSLEL